jgi:hypothetical protein
MPTPITYKAALLAMREDRIAETSIHGGPSRESMPVNELEQLGALIVAFLSKIGEAREHPAGGIEFHLDTLAGPLVIHYHVYHGDIFSRFDDPRRAADLGVNSNPHSGKWNFHHDRRDRAVEAFEAWQKQLDRILPR